MLRLLKIHMFLLFRKLEGPAPLAPHFRPPLNKLMPYMIVVQTATHIILCTLAGYFQVCLVWVPGKCQIGSSNDSYTFDSKCQSIVELFPVTERKIGNIYFLFSLTTEVRKKPLSGDTNYCFRRKMLFSKLLANPSFSH